MKRMDLPTLFTRLGLWVDQTARDGPEQMACDEILLRKARNPVLRIYRWARPWVSAGYFVAPSAARSVRPDLPLCRRWTGGGVVVHEGDFTFALVVPRAEPWATTAAAESYRQLHMVMVQALKAEGIDASLTQDPSGEPGECFRAPVAHDVMAGGRKIAGGAQKRTRLGLLHQGSLQGAAQPGVGFPDLLASALSREVFVWDPEGLEPELDRLVAEKYGNEEFLRGPRME